MIVTHEMGFAAKVSDRVLFLADGCIEEQEHRRNCSISRKARGCSIFCRRGVSASRG